MDDRSALHALKNKDETALAWFIKHYASYVSTIVYNIIGGSMTLSDVEEVSSDVFLVLWSNAAKIRPEKVKAYLSGIARNKAKEKTRQLGKDLPLEEDMLIISDADLERDIEAKEQARLLKSAILAMPHPEREIFLRHYYYYQSVAQISEEMCINISTVKTKLRRGRTKLKEILHEGGYEVEKKISDMMDYIQDDSISIQIKNFASSKKIKEATMSKLHSNTKTYAHKHKASRVLLIAAIIMMALSVSAFAIWRLSLRDLEGPKNAFSEPKVLSLSSIQGTTQYLAAAEWERYVQERFDAGENMVQSDYVLDEYGMYHAISQEAKDTLDALLAKYNLKMHAMPTNPRTLEELYSAVGVSGFMPAPGSGTQSCDGTVYEDGTFSFNCAATLPGTGSVDYQFYSFGKDYFNRGVYMLADRLEEPEEWTYTTSGGVDVLLALGSYKSIMAVDMSDCFIFVNIMSGRTNVAADNDGANAAFGASPLDKSALEAFAESFDLKLINGLSS